MRSPYRLVFAASLALTMAGCAEMPGMLEPAKIGSFALTPTTLPSGSLPSRIYVANESSNDVTVIDATTFQPVGTIPALNH